MAVTSLLLGSGLPNIADFRAPASVQDASGAVVAYSANTPGAHADDQARCGPASLQSRECCTCCLSLLLGAALTGDLLSEEQSHLSPHDCWAVCLQV